MFGIKNTLEGSLNPSVVSKIQIANQFVLKSGSPLAMEEGRDSRGEAD